MSNLILLNIRSNKFKGKIPSEVCQLNLLQILDASGNNLSGKIPKCFHNFTAMKEGADIPFLYQYFSFYVSMKGRIFMFNIILGLKSLDLSGNSLSGEIPDKMGDMKQLESLDLARNKLVGQIPATMSGLTFLSYLNLSYNMLSGEIPLGAQMLSFDASSYFGNKLCGPPLTTKSCNPRGDQTTKRKHPDEDGEEEEGVDWIIVFSVLGLMLGFAGVWVPMVVSKTWRYTYFRFLDSLWVKLDSVLISIWFGLKEWFYRRCMFHLYNL